MKDSPTPPDTENSGWLDTHPKAKWLATSRTTGYFSAAVVALVVLLVIVILVRGRSENTPTATPPPIAATTTAAPPNPSGTGGFGPSIADPFGREISVPLDEQGQVLPQTDPGERPAFTAGTPVPPPAGIKWERIGATVAPFSTSDGPTRIEGRLAYGFSRTPQGAALAGWQITARMLRSGDDVREAYERQIVADPGVAEAKLAKLSSEGRSDFRLDKLPIFPEAFLVTSYNADTAIVRYALPTAGHATWTLTQQTLTWTADGWKARLTATEPTLADITTLAGWTRW